MTILAYLHDCHCRYDERSTVQKKQWTHDKAKCRNSNRRPSIRFLKLHHLFCLRAELPVRKPTLVWARMTVWAVMPAQVVTPLETTESWDPEAPLLARNRLVLSLRLCRTAKLDLASARKSQRSVSQSTTAPMSSTACVQLVEHPRK